MVCGKGRKASSKNTEKFVRLARSREEQTTVEEEAKVCHCRVVSEFYCVRVQN